MGLLGAGAVRSVVQVFGGLLRLKASLFLPASLGPALPERRAAAAAAAWRLLCGAQGGCMWEAQAPLLREDAECWGESLVFAASLRGWRVGGPSVENLEAQPLRLEAVHAQGRGPHAAPAEFLLQRACA